MPRSCVPDIDVMDPQALDPVDMDDKYVNPHEAVGLVTSQATRARLGLGSKKARLGLSS